MLAQRRLDRRVKLRILSLAALVFYYICGKLLMLVIRTIFWEFQ